MGVVKGRQQLCRRGDADVMVAGGVEAAIDGVSLGGFCRLRALATKWNDAPTSASRPFDAARAGFVMGEGAGVVVLEELQHTLRRGAPQIHAEVQHSLSWAGQEWVILGLQSQQWP